MSMFVIIAVVGLLALAWPWLQKPAVKRTPTGA